MICTEEEAKKKWCPHAVASHTDPRFGFRENDNPADYKSHPCISSTCMSWRWLDDATLNEQGGSAAEYSSANRRGYCGLAGKP